MLALTVFGIGLAFVGIGVAVSGVLSTIFITTGIVVAVLSVFLYFGRKPSTAKAEPAAVTQTASARDVGPGAVAGNVIQHSTVTVTYEGGQPHTARRHLVEASPEHLVRFYRDNLTIQADSLVEPFVGKWMRVSGRVRDVSRHDRFTSLDLDRDPPKGEEQAAGLNLYFYDEKYIDERVRTLTRGQQVILVGKVEKASAWSVSLGDCEFEQPDQAGSP